MVGVGGATDDDDDGGVLAVLVALLVCCGHQFVRAATYGLDKSTVSRQLDQLIGDGLLLRVGERPGRRGQALLLTPAGEKVLAVAGSSGRGALVERLAHG